MPWYCRVLSAINVAVPFLRPPTQATNLALLVSAVLKKQTLCLSELARAYPTPKERRVPAPKHDLLHRLKRLWRFIGNERVDALRVHTSLLPYTIARLGFPRLLALAIDWTFFDTVLPSGSSDALPGVEDRRTPQRAGVAPFATGLRSGPSAGHQEPEPARAGGSGPSVRVLPGVRPVVLADRGFHRVGFIAWLERHRLDYVVRIKKGSCMTEADGRRWKLGEEGLKPGEIRFVEQVREDVIHHGRPRDLRINVALCWRISKSWAMNPRRKRPEEPWYLATSLPSAKSAVCWYWQRGWIEQSFKDSKGRFGLAGVRVGTPERLGRLLMALTIALSWLSLMSLPESGGPLPEGFRAAVSAWVRASLTSLALSLLERLGNLPLRCLPQPLRQE